MEERDIPLIKDLPDGVIFEATKRPVTLKVVLWDGTAYIADFLHQWSRGDVWLGGEELRVRTPEGIVSATLGSYIVCGVMGEFYPVQPQIFKETFEC